MSKYDSPTAVNQIAEYAANLTFDQLTPLSVIRARQVMLDTLGTILGGYQTRLGSLAADYAVAVYPGDEATLPADGRRTTIEAAAWATGVMGKFLGMDDSHRINGHVAAELVPVVLALSEYCKLSGRQTIKALAAGYEVMDIIQPAVKNWQRERGLDHKGQAGSMAAAVTAAVAMGLDAAGIANALALAMDMACGTEQYVYDAGKCDTKDLLAGQAARTGIQAARMAAFGFQGPPGALDGPYGYFHAFGPGYDPSYLKHLGENRALEEISFKPHAGCRHVHACVDAIQAIVREHHPHLDDIAAINIFSYEMAITPDFRVNPAPTSVGQAGFSLPVTAAVVLTRGSWYREDIETYDSPEARHLRGLVTVGLDDAAVAEFPDKHGCTVTLTLHDGTSLQKRVLDAKGDPDNMLSDAEFEQKFNTLIGNLLPRSQIERLIEHVSRLETLEDVGALVLLTRYEVMIE